MRPRGLSIHGGGIAILILVVVAAILIGLHFAARAQTVSCDNYDKIVTHLERHYQERTIAFGALPNGRLMQITVSAQGTFTVLIITPEKTACLAISGDGWQTVQDKGPQS